MSAELFNLDGAWLTSAGRIKIVKNGKFGNAGFTCKDGCSALLSHTGAVLNNGAVLSSSEVAWKDRSDTCIWKRWQVKDLDGIWLSCSSSTIKVVTQGRYCGSPIVLERDKVVLSGHIAHTIFDNVLTWERDGTGCRDTGA